MPMVSASEALRHRSPRHPHPLSILSGATAPDRARKPRGSGLGSVCEARGARRASSCARVCIIARSNTYYGQWPRAFLRQTEPVQCPRSLFPPRRYPQVFGRFARSSMKRRSAASQTAKPFCSNCASQRSRSSATGVTRMVHREMPHRADLGVRLAVFDRGQCAARPDCPTRSRGGHSTFLRSRPADPLRSLGLASPQSDREAVVPPQGLAPCRHSLRQARQQLPGHRHHRRYHLWCN